MAFSTRAAKRIADLRWKDEVSAEGTIVSDASDLAVLAAATSATLVADICLLGVPVGRHEERVLEYGEHGLARSRA